MENNNMNEQQTNWQQALNEFSNQPLQPQQYAQQAQPQFNQQAQFAQADGQYMQQGMPAYDAGSFAVVPPKKKSSAGRIALIVLLCIFALPVILPLGIAAVAVVFSLLVSVIAVLGSLVVAGVVILIVGIALVITAFLKLFLMPAAALYLLGGGLACTGIGLAMTAGMIWLVVKVVPVMCRGFVNLCRWPFTRRNAA